MSSSGRSSPRTRSWAAHADFRWDEGVATAMNEFAFAALSRCLKVIGVGLPAVTA